jgi:hypothetical protein
MSHQHDQTQPTTSEARLNANRQNAQNSTGPKTPEGKNVSSQNAVKAALTGRTVLLPTDNADRYQAHVQAFFQELAPEGQRETLLTQSLADIAWRLERIASFELAIYASDRTYYTETRLDEAEPVRQQLIELAIYRTNERELRNLHIQEARLRRQRDRDNEELRYLQAERRRAAEHQMELAAHAYQTAREQGTRFDPAALGFVFSTKEIERFLLLRKAEKAIAASRAEAPNSNPAFKKFRRGR